MSLFSSTHTESERVSKMHEMHDTRMFRGFSLKDLLNITQC